MKEHLHTMNSMTYKFVFKSVNHVSDAIQIVKQDQAIVKFSIEVAYNLVYDVVNAF